MKIKAYSCFIILFSLTCAAQAQGWFEDDCTWTYGWGQPGQVGYEKLTLEPGVTITNGMTCRTLHRYLQYGIYNSLTNQYDQFVEENLTGPEVCEVGDSVLFRNYSGELKLQYDFSMQPGDSLLYIEPFADCGFTLVVDSLGMINLQGEELRTQYATIYAGECFSVNPEIEILKYLIIERVGLVPITDDIYHRAYLIPQSVFNFIQDGESWRFRCFANDEFEYKITDLCEELPLGTDEPGHDKNPIFGISPNPAQNAITLVNRTGSTIYSTKIYGINGEVEMNIIGQGAQPIEIGHLQPGVHIVCVETEQGIFRQRLIKT
jgi:Secretion system C-terminal sorting domain